MDELPAKILDSARHIKLLVLDVDGVLTDGSLYYSEDGAELKAFNILDGLGIKLLQQAGIDVALITGRQSRLVARRAEELGITTLIQGCDKKLAALDSILDEKNLAYSETAYIGDDLPDLPCIRRVGFGVTVPNAPPVLRQHALCCTERYGGQGAVREVCELILQAQDKFEKALESYL